MIDYEKLKIAHELTKKLRFSYYCFESWCGLGFESGYFYTLKFEDNNNIFHEYESEEIEELIAKLTELTAPKYKYKVGDWIWCYSYENIPDRVQVEFHPEGNKNTYQVRHENGMTGFYEEERLYPSFDDLVEAQIKYWVNLRSEHNLEQAEKYYTDKDKNPKCQHESDGAIYTSYPPKNMCKKCQEFY